MRDRRIRIPQQAVSWATRADGGVVICIPVKVDWPELQLTEAQGIANAVARALGTPEPYPDQSLITVELERPG